MILWLCGKHTHIDYELSVCEIQGIFDSEEKAISACLNEKYFIGPMTLNEAIDFEKMDTWEGVYYPLAIGKNV